MKVKDLIRELQEWNENEEVMIGGWDFTQAFSIDRTSYESVSDPHDPERTPIDCVVIVPDDMYCII